MLEKQLEKVKQLRYIEFLLNRNNIELLSNRRNSFIQIEKEVIKLINNKSRNTEERIYFIIKNNMNMNVLFSELGTELDELRQ